MSPSSLTSTGRNGHAPVRVPWHGSLSSCAGLGAEDVDLAGTALDDHCRRRRLRSARCNLTFGERNDDA
jgi:hypothetical protein